MQPLKEVSVLNQCQWLGINICEDDDNNNNNNNSNNEEETDWEARMRMGNARLLELREKMRRRFYEKYGWFYPLRFLFGSGGGESKKKRPRYKCRQLPFNMFSGPCATFLAS